MQQPKGSQEMKSTENCAKHVKAGALFKAGALILSGIAALVLQVPLAQAVDVGLGVALEGSGSTVMIPIRIDFLFIEPEVQIQSQSQSGFKFRSVTPGVGVYYRKELGPLFEGYLGGKLSFTTTK